MGAFAYGRKQGEDSLRILVVDDDAVIRKMAALSLTKAGGHQVTCVSDGARAAESALAENPDAILLDLRMPEVDGLEVLRRLKTETSTRQIPVVMLSAATEVSDVNEALALGAAGWIAKPFDPRTLGEQLTKVLLGINR